MTTLPPATDFTGASVTEGQFKTAMTSLRDYLSQLLGDDSILREGDDLVINGAMAVAQEGTSFTGVGAAATNAAVISCLLILFLDFLLAALILF